MCAKKGQEWVNLCACIPIVVQSKTTHLCKTTAPSSTCFPLVPIHPFIVGLGSSYSCYSFAFLAQTIPEKTGRFIIRNYYSLNSIFLKYALCRFRLPEVFAQPIVSFPFHCCNNIIHAIIKNQHILASLGIDSKVSFHQKRMRSDYSKSKTKPKYQSNLKTFRPTSSVILQRQMVSIKRTEIL